ncbi:biotin--[acetyl-CoA-carboxylase] ligase [Nitrospina gracilis]|uniref:biotin--[acetyl-CoA-carboxylase] ligase n=1 Tax=Nitrospina gracilis TaxID=35801 RepID=UPI001F00D404|nr:biotin--[acetyl-CoA-carboxylase] ligase [Nitrospina gracilis]MCF8720392.1 BirA family biotin operon repressor/biotin-[acetyl-CoA-carboxylase] ligase [Nitrospina gracilis Nb-211]
MPYLQEELDAIQNQLQTLPWAGEIIAYDQVDSTNDLAKNLLFQGAPEGTVVIADSQTRGKGRLGRSWYSEPDTGLYFSLVLKPTLAQDHIPNLTLMAAVAVVEALNQINSQNATLKWPNDILLNGRKLGGILSEQVVDGPHPGVIIGIGLNVSQDRFPEDIAELATSLLIETGTHPARYELLSNIIRNLHNYYQILLEDNVGLILSHWRQNTRMLGVPILLRRGHQTHSGIAMDLDDCGRLVVHLDSGEELAFDSGEVTLRQ